MARLRLPAPTPLRPALAALAAAAVLAISAVPPAAAQAHERPDGREGRQDPAGSAAGGAAGAPDSTGRIGGFFDVPWHADSAAVVEKLGPPISVARTDDGLRIFHYTPWFLDRDGFLALWLAEGEGMVHGSYEPVVGDCTRMLREMVRELNRRYRELSPSTRGDLGGGGLRKDLCLAAIEDGARLTVTWEDASGNRIRVGSGPERPALLMTATSAGWRRP